MNLTADLPGDDMWQFYCSVRLCSKFKDGSAAVDVNILYVHTLFNLMFHVIL